MEFVEPRVYHLATTKLVPTGLAGYLEDIGVPEWTTNAVSDGEKLIEIGGKSCYRSFREDLNPNLTRVRKNDNRAYIQEGIVGVGHGSVLEHVHDTVILTGVSRILTHELVRHRIASYSQESLRFVRLSELKAYFPDAFKNDGGLREVRDILARKGLKLDTDEDWMRGRMEEVFEYLEDVQLEFANKLQLDNLEGFAIKKKLTSAMRRMAPDGLATAVMMTTNLRQWRLIIKKRTSRHAEEEIRKVTARIYEILSETYPSVFADAQLRYADGLLEIDFENDCG